MLTLNLITLKPYLLLCLQYNRSGTDSEEGVVLNHPTLTIAEDLVVNKRAGIARTIAKPVLQVAALITTHVDDAMIHVDRRIISLNRGIALGSLHVSADDIVTHLQG